MVADNSREERLQKAFLDVQSHSAGLVNLTVQCKDLEDILLHKRFEDLEQKGKENGKEKQSTAETTTGSPNETAEKKYTAERDAGSTNKTSEKNPTAKESTENPKKTSALKYDVKPRPKLKFLCENMDGEGLREFLASAREDAAVRNEVPVALRCAADPAKLVL